VLLLPRIFPSGRNFSACDRAGTRQPRTFTAVVQKFTGLSFSPPKNNETTLAKRATGRSRALSTNGVSKNWHLPALRMRMIR
jgi:hypothetical protein